MPSMTPTNWIDHARNASYGLIRLTLANIVEHAVVRYLEAVKRCSRKGSSPRP